VMGVIAAAFMWSDRATRRLVARHEEIDGQYAEAAKRLDTVKQMQEKQRRMAHQAEVTASLLERVPRSYLLAEFTNSLPAGVSLIDMALESKAKQAPAAPAKSAFEQQKAALEAKAKPAAPPVAQAKAYDVGIRLTGVAQTDVQVAQFINKLSRSKLLQDVNLVIVDQFKVEQDNVRKFQLDMLLNPEAAVDPLKPGTKTAAVELGAK
jgi:Tfp pilus assembly protein PilN